MKKRSGISLIVLIVTIIVIIILAGVVILTLSKNNPIEGAKEAKFKEDVRSFQDDLSLTISKEYIDLQGNRDSKINATSYEDITKAIPSFTKEYENKLIIQNDSLMYVEGKTNEKEVKWLNDMQIPVKSSVPDEWQHSIVSVTEDGVPVPKGFEYVTGTKDTGTVIQDEKGNQFVWVPATADTYVKDFSFSGVESKFPTGDDTLPNGIENETTDVVKYGGFYIERYEAGVPDGQTLIDGNSEESSNKVDVPVCKQGATVWTWIDYTNAKASAEQMISNEYVQTGLITGKSWDTTCHFMEDSVISLTESGTYGNYSDSKPPANVEGYGSKQVAGYSDKWMVKNIYDLAGSVYEWTSEIYNSGYFVRGGAFSLPGNNSGLFPVSRRENYRGSGYGSTGFRPRLYIK